MTDTYRTYPFWRSTLEDAEHAVLNAGIGEPHILCTTPGGHTVRYLTYGEKADYGRKANYSSACGARDPAYYADRAGRRPTVLLFGATHGQETEGVAALLNLVSLLETGRDLRGEEVPSLLEAYAASDCRLILLPVYNADGRARCLPDSMIDEPNESLRYHGQGTWKDGSLCGWPECKSVHPIKDAAGFLGAYYNDDGVNLMHDNFFAPMARKTASLLRLADEEAPEIAIGLHGGSNSTNVLLQPSYVPLRIAQSVHELASRNAELETAHGFRPSVQPVSEKREGWPPPSFNLTSALHHVCGGISVTYESNEGLREPGAFGAEEILLRHYCLFEAVFRFVAREKVSSRS